MASQKRGQKQNQKHACEIQAQFASLKVKDTIYVILKEGTYTITHLLPMSGQLVSSWSKGHKL